MPEPSKGQSGDKIDHAPFGALPHRLAGDSISECKPHTRAIMLSRILKPFKGRSSGKNCKTYRTNVGVTINRCKDAGKTFVHKSSTKKATNDKELCLQGQDKIDIVASRDVDA